MTDNWDATIEPARVALEALIKRGDEMADYVQKLQTKVFLQEKHIWELEAKLAAKACPLGDECDLTVTYMAGAEKANDTIRQQEQEIERLRSIIREIADKVSSSPLRASYPDIDANQIRKEIGT